MRSTGRCAFVHAPQTRPAASTFAPRYDNSAPAPILAGLFAQTNTSLLLSTTRAYNPANGKWLNVDPIREAGGINLTGYVGGGPISAIDPLGLLNPKDDFSDPNDPDSGYGGFDWYNPIGVYPITGHGSKQGKAIGLIVGPGKIGLDPEFVLKKMLENGWDRKTPIAVLICHAANGGINSFVAKLSELAAKEAGQPIDVYGTVGNVEQYPFLPPPFTVRIIIYPSGIIRFRNGLPVEFYPGYFPPWE